MKFWIELGASPTLVPPDFDALTDLLQEELEKLDSIVDPDLLVNLQTGQVLASMEVEAPDMMQANIFAVSSLRAALHALGERTPGWERMLGSFNASVESAELVAA